LLLVCAQRLLRKTCPHCKETFTVPAEMIHRLGMSEADLNATTFHRGHGCGRCKNTGFLGRMAILEVLPVTQNLRQQILHNSSAQVVKETALKEGMRTLRMVGLDKAKAGMTSLDEVLRVTGDDH
jgi:type II secretory ATPase GspE/PulE/Tfp pilus assembly ATPase PilB-like protein